jgi:hypothetical protein
MRNPLKNEEHFESSEGIYPSHTKREWVEGGETWIGCMSATARLRHAFVPPGPYHVGSCPWSLQIRYAGQGLLIQIAVDSLMNHELTRRPTLDFADLLANGSEQQLFSNVG